MSIATLIFDLLLLAKTVLECKVENSAFSKASNLGVHHDLVALNHNLISRRGFRCR